MLGRMGKRGRRQGAKVKGCRERVKSAGKKGKGARGESGHEVQEGVVRLEWGVLS